MSLPPLITLADPGGDPEVYLDRVYDIFKETVVRAGLHFLGKPIKCRWEKPYKNKHFCFWHIISEGYVEEERTPDMRRCERVGWVNFVVSNVDDHQKIWCWENRRSSSKGNKTRTILYLHEERYVVVLEERREAYYLITTFCVERQHRHEKLIKEKKSSSDPRNGRGRH